MTVDYADWQTSADHAQKIYERTVPLGRKPLGIANANGAIAASGNAVLVNAAAVSQPSFHMLIAFSYPLANSTTPFILLTFNWTDAASGFAVTSDECVIAGGLAALDFHYIAGPARADTLTITAFNLDPVNIASFSFGISQQSHVYQTLRLVEVGQPTVPQFTRAGQNNQLGIIGSVGANLAASGMVDRLCSAWGGPAVITVNNITGTVGVNVSLMDPGIIGGGSPILGVANSGVIWSAPVPSGTSVSEMVYLPYGPVVVHEVNQSATTGVTPTTTIVRAAA